MPILFVLGKRDGVLEFTEVGKNLVNALTFKIPLLAIGKERLRRITPPLRPLPDRSSQRCSQNHPRP